MLTAIYTDLHARIAAVLDANHVAYKLHYGALDDVLARAAVRKVTIAISPSNTDWQVDGDSPNITLASNEFTVGVHVESVPDLPIVTMGIVDAITSALHGDDSFDGESRVYYLIRSVSHGASTQSTDRYDITLTAETYYYA
jgi:hypothetical protein